MRYALGRDRTVLVFVLRLTIICSLAVGCIPRALAAQAAHPSLRDICSVPKPGPDARPYVKRGVVFMVPDTVARADSLAPSWWNDEWLPRAPAPHWLEVDGATARLARAMFERMLPNIPSYFQSAGRHGPFRSAVTELVRCAAVPGGPDFLMVAHTKPDGSSGWYNVYASWSLELSDAPGFWGGSDTESGARALLAAFRHQTLASVPTDAAPSVQPPQN